MRLKEKTLEGEIQERDKRIQELCSQKDKDLEKIERYGETLKQDFDHQLSQMLEQYNQKLNIYEA